MSKLTFVVPNFPGKEKLIGVCSRTALKISKHSPAICLGAGIAVGVGATVMACRSTLRVGAIIDEHNETMEKINYAMQCAAEGHPIKDYTVEEGQKEKFILFVQTAVKVGKLYAPAIILGMTSIGLLLGSHHILMKRNAALSLAYAGLQKAYDEYRGRVRDAVGEEKENDIFKGVVEKVEEVEGKNGKIVKKKTSELTHPTNPYTRIFDQASCWWKKDPEQNRFFLQVQQNHANDLLRIRGHLFLNEVFDMLDLPRTKEGSVCGWIYGEGDSFVDFGIWDATKQGVRDFINARENCVWLDFNCDGLIFDKI